MQLSREMIFLAFESKQILNTTMYINVQYVKYTKNYALVSSSLCLVFCSRNQDSVHVQ